MAPAYGMEKAQAKGSAHVMMLPSLGHGHLIPFMQLAKKLAAKGLTISFVTTFHHIQSLQGRVNAARENGLDIQLLEMEVPKDHLTLGKVNSNSVQWHQLPPLLAADEGLQPHFELFLVRFLGGEISPLPTPLCLIADFLLGWSSAVGKKFGIPRVSFETSGMFGESVQQIVWDELPRNLPRTASGRYLVPGVPREVRLSRLQMLPELPEATTENGTHQFWVRQRRGNKQSWRTLVNTFYELEGEFVDHFERVNGTLRTIGPLLPPEAFEDRRHGRRIAPAVEMGANTDEEKCLQWLDAQAESSVLYISFGSENSISTVQMEHLALGIEASGVKFAWVLRTPSDVGNRSFSSALDFLPPGFHGRMAERNQGLFLLGWAPQLSILAHPSTGGFLSHCGWNAVLETTTMGVPMIAWPLYAEQHFNSKFVVDELQVALEAPQRFDEGWLVTKEDVERSVRSLMVEEKGKELRERVQRLKAKARAAVAEGGSSSKNFDLFVSEVLALQQV
uniref:Glycosyltransferase n=1 Tax=Araucaria cunninghamii TaxID=56994 RepID=A0A0D6QV50_ARACU